MVPRASSLNTEFFIRLLALMAGIAWGAPTGRAQVIADLRADYDTPFMAFSQSDTSAGKIFDSANLGSWNFYSSLTANPTDAGANLTYLTYATTANGVRAANAFVSAVGGAYDLPAWSNDVLITPAYNDGAPAANELEVHPGEGAVWAVAKWTSGSAGTVRLSGAFHDIGTTDNGVTFEIFLNGACIFSTTTDGNTVYSFDQTFAVAVNDTLYFSIGNNGSFGGDSSALSATITAIPEPSTWAMLAGLTAVGVVAWRRRR